MLEHPNSEFKDKFSPHFKSNFNFIFSNYPNNILSWGATKLFSDIMVSNPTQKDKLSKKPFANFII